MAGKEGSCLGLFIISPVQESENKPYFCSKRYLMAEEKVILVDGHDNETGEMEKIEAHKKALLHRAFSIFVFNDRGEMMLQQRASSKYHSPGLWTNACCSHPRPGESTEEAAKRRIVEEMGFSCPMKESFTFIYHAPFDHGLTEHELDHVFIGTYNGDPKINRNEVENWKWIDIDTLLSDVQKNPDNYTVWFKIALKKLKEKDLI